MMTPAIVAAVLLAQPAAPVSAAPPGAPVLTLEDALREARARNLDLKATQARLQQSKELHWQAWSAQLPQVAASATLTHHDYSNVTIAAGALGPRAPEVLLARQNEVAAQIQATQPLVAPQAWFAIAAARAGERLAADTAENARRDVLFSTAQAYYSAAGLKQVVAVQGRQLAIARDHEKDAQIRFDAGVIPKISLLRAQIDRSRAEQDLKRAQNSYASGKEALAALLDRRDAAFEVNVPPPPAVPAGPPEALEEAAARDRPDLQAAAEAVTVAERTRQGVFTRYFPTLSAFGRYQYFNAAGFAGQDTTWAIGVAATWTLLDGLLRESDLRQSGARVREAEATRASATVKARAEVRQSRLDLDSAVANRQKAGEQLALARENQRLVDVNYKAGTATYLEVSDANTALLTAELSQVSESLNADLAALRLLRAAGAFNPT